MTDKRIETYLRKSTRGLWGRKKTEVREELSAHIQGRVHGYLVAGYSERDALEKTLIELGHPTHVSVGMARLHTLPLVAGSGMALAMCCALVVVLLSGSTAQTLKVSNIFPTDTCLNSKEATLPYYCQVGGWTNIESLRAALEPQGVIFEPRDIGGWSLDFPDGSPVIVGNPYNVGEWYFDGAEENDEITLRPNADYVHIRNFIGQLSTTGLPISIKGWDKPTLYVGDVVLEIDLSAAKSDANYGGASFYFEAFNWGLAMDAIPLIKTYQAWATKESVDTEPKKFKVADTEGTVYGLVVILDGDKDSNVEPESVSTTSVVYTDVERVDANGFVKLNVPKDQQLTFVSRAIDMNKNGLAMFARLSGDLGISGSYVTTPPDQIQME
jgi:hypothetical protein